MVQFLAQTAAGRLAPLSCVRAKDRVISRYPERFIVKLVDGSSVGEPKPAWPGREPFEGRRFYNVLIFNQSVFVSLVVSDFKLVYLPRFSDLHSLLSCWCR